MGNERSADVGFVNQETRGGPQYFSLFVPNRPSYLRLGETPADGDATFKVEVRATLGLPGDTDHRVFDHIMKDVVDDSAMDGNFIHSPVDPLALHAETGWADHCEGNRLTTTGGDKVEVIKGSYKLITCGGQAGIDFSGGHMRTWSKTPGYISQVDADGHAATMTIEAKERYALRFHGGDYDEFWGGTSYCSYYGVEPSAATYAAAAPPAGVPSIGPRLPIAAMARHHQEVHAKIISEHLEGDEHTAHVQAKSHFSRVVADTIEQRLESKTSVLQVAQTGDSAKISQIISSNKIEESYTFGTTKLSTVLARDQYTQKIAAGGGSVETMVSSSEIRDHWNGGQHVTRRYGAVGLTASAYGANITMDDSVAKVDQIYSRFWLECHAGMKYKKGKSVDVTESASASVLMTKLGITKSKLTIFG